NRVMLSTLRWGCLFLLSFATLFIDRLLLNNTNRNKDTEHGLGLAIVAQIAKWHQGEVTIDDANTEHFNNECRTCLVNKGAKISLIWPVNL
ncbi:MAG: signal transduction histidine kinase, partial [Oceanospirillaceae bacterium]